MTDASAFAMAATCLSGISVATGITLRMFRRRPYAPMFGLLVAGGVLDVVASVLSRDWKAVFIGLGLSAVILGMLVREAAKARP